MTQTYNNLPAPEVMGPVFLHHLKQGVPVRRITVWLSHVSIHYIWSGSSKFERMLRAKYPLEKTFALPGTEPKVIDCRQFTAPWHVSVPTAKEALMKWLTEALQSPNPTLFLSHRPDQLDRVIELAKVHADVEALYRAVLGTQPSDRGPLPDAH